MEAGGVAYVVAWDRSGQANAWQANRRTANRYPRCIPRAHRLGVTIDRNRAFLCHIGSAPKDYCPRSKKLDCYQTLLGEQARPFPP
jgi:hypothetical protein